MFIVGAIALYLLIALLTYDPGDPGWSYSGPTGEVHNVGGVVGAYVADVALYLFGYMAFLFPLLLAYGGWLVTRRMLPTGMLDWPHLALRGIGFVASCQDSPCTESDTALGVGDLFLRGKYRFLRRDWAELQRPAIRVVGAFR